MNDVNTKKPNKFMSFVKNNASEVSSVAGLVFCLLIFTITTAGMLWDPFNIELIATGVVIYFIISLGAIFIYSMGYMDVSIGAQLGVYSILLIQILDKTGSLALGVLAVLAIALFCGLINGVVAVFLKLPSIVTSLFITSIFTGIQMIMTEEITKNYTPASNQVKFLVFDGNKLDIFQSPGLIIAVMIVACVIASYFFIYTRLGKYVKSIGANERTTEQCGVNTTLWKTLGYSALGIGIAIASVFYISSTKLAGKDSGSGYAMVVMLCLILGGMPLSGGMKSKIRCAVIGSLTYIILEKGLILTGIDTNYVNLIKAIVFLGVVLLTSRSKDQYLPR